MAHQDYVARTRKPKNKSPYKGKEEPAPSGLPVKIKIFAIVTLIALVGFGFILWKLNQVEPQATPEVKSSVNNKEIELPEPYVEKWDYIDGLKEKKVEEGQYTVEDKGPFKMQCGSFRTMTQAEKMRAKMAFLGLEAKIKGVTGKNGKWYQVYLGPYERKRAAEADKHRINSNNIANSCDIWLWR